MPVTSTVVGSPPAVALRSQNTVAVPYTVLAAKLTFVSVKPYSGDGVSSAAAHAVVDIAKRAVALAPLSTPPGALVVSTSTTAEPATCGAAVGKDEPLPVGVGDTDLVPLGVGDTDLVPLGVGELEPVDDGVEDGELVNDCVAADDEPAEADGVALGVGDADAATTPIT